MDCVSVLYRITLRVSNCVAVRVGHAFYVSDDLVDALELVHVVWDELEQLVGQRVGLDDGVAVDECELMWDRVFVLHCITVRYSNSVSV